MANVFQLLVVAGGGSGGNSNTTNGNGGGGGGGVLHGTAVSLDGTVNYTVSVGAGVIIKTFNFCLMSNCLIIKPPNI